MCTVHTPQIAKMFSGSTLAAAGLVVVASGSLAAVVRPVFRRGPTSRYAQACGMLPTQWNAPRRRTHAQKAQTRRRLAGGSDRNRLRYPCAGWLRNLLFGSFSGGPARCQPLRDGGGYEGLIGNTPMVRLQSLSAATGCDILVKVEYLNPGGTSKDRIAASMIKDAEASGRLKKGGTVVEGTSGSTGICLASLCRAKGYRCVIVMPDDQASEKADLLRIFGAEVIKVKTASIANPDHYINVAARFAQERPGYVFMDQFETEANLRAHRDHTGPEIWEQTSGRLDAFVMGAGTGGCLAGVSLFFRGKGCSAKVYLVDPPGSALFNRVRYGVCYSPQMSERDVKKHRYDTIAEGIGNDHVTGNFGKAIIDDAFRVTDQEAVYMAHYLLRHEGLFVGCSSAMNCVGAVLAARRLRQERTGRAKVRMVTVLCDSGSRGVSRFWNREFVEARGLKWPLPGDATLENLDFIETRA